MAREFGHLTRKANTTTSVSLPARKNTRLQKQSRAVAKKLASLVFAGVVATVCILLSCETTWAQWSQWGGDARNFNLTESTLTTIWPPSKPKLLWKHSLGDGESSVLLDNGTLYTMYRDEEKQEEVVVALSANTGSRLWEYRYRVTIPESYFVQNGSGPHATPLTRNGKLYALGTTGKLHCLEQKTGKLIWAHDLVEKFGGQPPTCGYGASPLIYENTLIVQVGGEGHAVMSFNLADGKVIWSRQDFGAGYAAPILIKIAGEEQVVVFTHGDVVGLDPKNGTLKWTHPHKTDFGVNASMPIWGKDQILFITSAYSSGSRGLQLISDASRISVEELWHQKKMQVHFNNVVRVGDYVYGTSGDFGPVFLMAVHAKTGAIAWQKRDIIGKASILHSGNKLMLLDEKGKLVMVRVSPQDVMVDATHQLLDGRVWTAPTVVGTRLYVRNRKNIYAFDFK